MSKRQIESLLKQVFYDIKNQASFSSPRRLYNSVKKRIPSLKLEHVEDFLSRQDAYTLHRPVRHVFPRRKTVVRARDSQWQTDLIVLPALSRHNDNYKYILVAIDVLSRYAFAEPLKTKSGKNVVAGFSKILTRSKRKPLKLQSDDGKEYLNRKFQAFLKEKNIIHFTTSSDTKSALAERLIRTLLSRLYRYFTAKNTLRYINVLQDLVMSYNNRKHRSIGCAPSDVTKRNEKEIWDRLYKKYFQEKEKRFKFNIGDRVRITHLRRQFVKGYLPAWSSEVFIILNRHNTRPPVYTLTDSQHQVLKGSFYEPELGIVK